MRNLDISERGISYASKCDPKRSDSLILKVTKTVTVGAVCIAAIIAAAVGALLAVPASKLVFHFLSLSTIAFGEIVYQLLVHSPGAITGDFKGIYSTQMTFFGQAFSYRNFFYFALICAFIFLLAKFFLVNSKTGRAFTAIRENSHAANGMGVDMCHNPRQIRGI
mgnify:CR=1 FL=1